MPARKSIPQHTRVGMLNEKVVCKQQRSSCKEKHFATQQKGDTYKIMVISYNPGERGC
jgi:hypothetical protein